MMEPRAYEMEMWHIETTEGTEYVPADLTDALSAGSFAGLTHYLSGEMISGETPEIVRGWYAHLTMPGYLDRTDWVGPCASEAAALLELAETYDCCPACGASQYWEYDDNPACDHEAEEQRLRKERHE